VIALPDPRAEKNLFEISVPDGLSLLATHSRGGRVAGLKEFPRENRPSVPVLFLTFRIMIAIGTLLLLVMIWASFLWRKGRLYDDRPFLWTLLIVHPLGFFAVETGWIKPKPGSALFVYNRCVRPRAISDSGENVVRSFRFLIIFAAIGSIYSYYVMKMIQRGPDLSSPIPPVQRPAGMRALNEHERTTKA
jgi:cytochrome d ubiquinol oxidase subunit I